MSLILELAERGWLPDGVICVGIRQLLRQRLPRAAAAAVSAPVDSCAEASRRRRAP